MRDGRSEKESPAVITGSGESLNIYFIFFIAWVFCSHVCLYTAYIQCSQRTEEGVGCPRTGIVDSCEQQSTPGPVEEQPGLLAEPSLQLPQERVFKEVQGLCSESG